MARGRVRMSRAQSSCILGSPGTKGLNTEIIEMGPPAGDRTAEPPPNFCRLVTDEIVQVAKAAAELEPAVEAFAEATGALEPVREATGWFADIVRYHRLPHQAKLLVRAAEKIRASGLPAHAVPDKTLRAILEDGPLEDDESMQERWANLLTNAAVAKGGDPLKIAYPKILAELEPAEAQLLERLVDRSPDLESHPAETFGYETTNDLVDLPELHNLVRLGLLRWALSAGHTWGEVANAEVNVEGVQLTELGWAFVAFCRTPSVEPDRKVEAS